MKKALVKIDQYLERWLCVSFYLMVFVVILAEVIQRFVLQYSTAWGEEIARYSFIYLIWVGVSMCVKDRIHLKIDLLVKSLPNRWKSFFYLIQELVTIGVVCAGIYLSFETVLLSFEYGSVTAGLRVIKGIFLFAVPFGLSLTLIRCVQNLIIDLINFFGNKKANEGKAIF